jgi:hypothetical protein
MTADNSISEFDCRPAPRIQSESLPAPEIDYLAKDFASFRRLMLDRLTTVLPDWQERNPADLGVALVEVLAYAADQLSYYQDAVATEAYLGTARHRISVKRHARLLDYVVHEGCNARTWIQFQVAEDVSLAQGTPLLTRVEGVGLIIGPGSPDFYQALASAPQVFETMYPAQLYQAHNEIHFHVPEASAEFYLPQGSTQALLDDSLQNLNLKVGDVLILEEVLGQTTGLDRDANPDRCQAVRLTRVAPDHTQGLIAIEWHAQDALPFDLCVSKRVAGKLVGNMSVARGNVVLADHGRTLPEEALPSTPKSGSYRPRLGRSDTTYSTSYNAAAAQAQAASAVVIQDPRAALPAITLSLNEEIWTPHRDLLNSDRFARDFVVEVDNAERAHLRFGDGVRGRRPPAGSVPRAAYRSGNGTPGNIGRAAIAHVVTTEAQIIGVRNPLPARGGARPESLEQVRLHAPQAFRTQERCVTAADYVEAAQRHPEVDRATASLEWTGGWHTMFVAIERTGNRSVDPLFVAELRAFLEHFRLAGCDLEICPPRFVPLDIALTVQVAPRSFRATVNQALLEIFSDVALPDGRRGFFHPDNLTFGQPVYLSQIVAAAMRAPGVEWLQTVRFQHWGQPARDELDEGRIKIGPLEIARLDNDPDQPENGRIEFILEGGL